MLPSIGYLKFSKLNFDNTCVYLGNKYTCSTETINHRLDLMTFFKRIDPFVDKIIQSHGIQHPRK